MRGEWRVYSFIPLIYNNNSSSVLGSVRNKCSKCVRPLFFLERGLVAVLINDSKTVHQITGRASSATLLLYNFKIQLPLL